MLMPAMLLITVLLFAWGVTGGMRHYALRRNILDMPNQRSSHSVPTPRGGGMAIVLSFMLALLVFLFQGLVEPEHAVALLGGGGAGCPDRFSRRSRPCTGTLAPVGTFPGSWLGALLVGRLAAVTAG